MPTSYVAANLPTSWANKVPMPVAGCAAPRHRYPHATATPSYSTRLLAESIPEETGVFYCRKRVELSESTRHFLTANRSINTTCINLIF